MRRDNPRDGSAWGLLARQVLASSIAVALCADALPLVGQLPLGSRSGRGQTVTPAYEGWYENEDGTISLSFGYMNRNFAETVDIPLGPDNMIEPAEFQGPQPTSFAPRRHFGVFVVRVPANYGEGMDAKVYWTLRMMGQTFRVPGHLHVDWKIDALKGEAGGGNTPPVLHFPPVSGMGAGAEGSEGAGGGSAGESAGTGGGERAEGAGVGERAGAEGGGAGIGGGERTEGAGPAGVWGAPLTARVGEPLDVTVFARDDGIGGSSVRGVQSEPPVNLAWFKHQGPGAVTFGERTARVPSSGGPATTTATFDEAGEYILRVRANDSSVSSAGHAQCCWTNAFVRVTVAPATER